MRTLRIGVVGDDVKAWEYFLLGNDPSCEIVADGKFDPVTAEETKQFQTRVGFIGRNVDGEVGPLTLGKAFALGFNPLDDTSSDVSGPNWPEPDANSIPLTSDNRAKLFGTFSYVSSGTASNPEAITITDNWANKNIVTIEIPQLKGIKGLGLIPKVSCHKLIVPQLQRLFAAWEQEGLMHKVLTWDGCWNPRFIRGSRTTLSNHAWGTAFDICAQWNRLGAQPALKFQPGSVRELVKTAERHGFFWGGHFKSRLDGQHFEASRIIV